MDETPMLGPPPGAASTEPLPASVWLGDPGKEGLAGRTVLVTGSGRNIGRAIALAFGDAGSNVVVNARSNRAEAEAVAAEVDAGNGRAIAVVGDIADPAFDQRLVGAAIEAFGTVDVLVNCASQRRRQPFLEITPQDWDEIVGSNLSSMFFLSRLVIGGMVERRWGRIITLGGPNTLDGAAYRAHARAAKAGAVGLTKALAAEFAHAGITANIVGPGMTDTTRDPADYPGWPPSPAQVASRVPAARLGQADEIAFACRFLASDAAAYITGQTLHVNGGMYMP